MISSIKPVTVLIVWIDNMMLVLAKKEGLVCSQIASYYFLFFCWLLFYLGFVFGVDGGSAISSQS